MFGPPGIGKSHLAAALGLALIENGWRVIFARTTDFVQKLQLARRDLALEAAIDKTDKYHLLILDDLAYVAKIRPIRQSRYNKSSSSLSLRVNPNKRQKNPLGLLPLRDNHPHTATAISHPECRALLTVAP